MPWKNYKEDTYLGIHDCPAPKPNDQKVNGAAIGTIWECPDCGAEWKVRYDTPKLAAKAVEPAAGSGKHERLDRCLVRSINPIMATGAVGPADLPPDSD